LKRPRTELVDAMKGRTVYLPVNVQANADFYSKKSVQGQIL